MQAVFCMYFILFSILREQLNLLEDAIFTFKRKEIYDQKEERNPCKYLELLIIFRINFTIQLGLLHLINLRLQGFQSRVGIVRTDIHAVSCRRNLLAHLLIHLCYNHISCIIFQEIVISIYWNWRAFGISHPYDIDMNTLFRCSFSRTNRIVFMVFTIGNQDNCLV